MSQTAEAAWSQHFWGGGRYVGKHVHQAAPTGREALPWLEVKCSTCKERRPVRRSPDGAIEWPEGWTAR